MPATTRNPEKSGAATPSKKEEAYLNGKGPKFVRCDLNKAQKEALVAWAADAETIDMLEWLYSRVVSGHVVSIRSLDVGYQCSITGMTEGSGHKDMCLTARASTPERAIMGAWFRDAQVLADGWPLTSGFEGLDF